MFLKDNIKKLWFIISEYFLIPFCSVISTVFILISILGLKSYTVNGLLFLYAGLIIGFFTLFSWFKRFKPRDVTINILVVCSKILFLIDLFTLLVINYIYQDTSTINIANTILLFALFFSGYIFLYYGRYKINTNLDKIQQFDVNDKNITTNKTLHIKNLINYFKQKNTLYGICIIIIIAIGLWLRLNHISSLFFWVDEANSMMVANRIAHGYGQTWMSGIFYPRGIIYHHYIATLIQYISDNLYYIGRAANIPFFISIIITIYYFCKKISTRLSGVIATILFSFSWLSISIFREARFYEMWLAFFLLLIFLVYSLIDKYLKTKGNVLDFIKNEKKLISIILAVGIISYDCQQLTVVIIYPLITFSFLILFFINKLKGIYLTLSSLFVLFLSLFYAYGSSAFSHLLLQKIPDWKNLYPSTLVLEFYKYMLSNDYGYLNLVLIIIILITIIFRRRIEILFLSSFIFTWYFFIAYQGYEVSMMRYYYPILPILAIFITYCSVILIKAYKTKDVKIAFIILLIILAIFSLRSGINESNSILTNNSKNYFKNDNFAKELLFIKRNINIESSTIITTNIWSLPYILYFNRTPDNIIIDDKITPYDTGKIDPVTNIREISYRDISEELSDIKIKPIYVIYNYPSMRISEESYNILNKLGKEIFKDGNVRILKITL